MTAPIMRHFAWQHLNADLQQVSRPFSDLARLVDLTLPDGPEKSVALRKLLEAKDAAVRAAVPLHPEIPEDPQILRR